ncbi:acyl-CoA N-acyltransferase [Dactylonectria macrodidyma]|uniref:Acyl-CoA N-acyltransferase n=1 Tax=Dactylonectria macrodidyma TaxID=307937 RepID=A0A9P9EYW9_9HYPO|nr:acyl-CoA N-acyltransferase [Dactylonectria macrodidyma]
MAPTYHLRPGTYSDIPAASSLYIQSFDKEPLLDYMFPGRHDDRAPFDTWILRRFRLRYWTSGYFLTMVFSGRGRAVGFTWWHRPLVSLSFRERWLTPYAWFRPVASAILTLHSRLFPIPSIDNHRLGVYDRVFAAIGPGILNSPRRRAAWYLSSLGVDPAVQGHGVGAMLVRDGLRKADREGVATWLVGLRGLERYYSRFGFVEVARANVGELKDWEGGSIMFRSE